MYMRLSEYTYWILGVLVLISSPILWFLFDEKFTVFGYICYGMLLHSLVIESILKYKEYKHNK